MPFEFKLIRQVEFHETDMAGIMHFSNFFRLMEAAEHAFFRSIGYSIHTTQIADPVGWPRVHTDCDFHRPLRFEDQVEIHLLVKERRPRSIAYHFKFRNLTADPSAVIAHGNLVVACVRRDGETGAMKAVPIPDEIAARIEPAPAELFE